MAAETPTPAARQPPESPARSRCRIRFGKAGPLRYTSHLDLARTWERLLRRAGLPLVYSQGFNPRPRMQLAAALPLGCASTAEVLDIWLEGSAPEPEAMLSRLREVAPEGLSVESVEVVDLRGPALQTLTRSAAYEIVVGDAIDRAALVERVEALLARSEIWRERRGKRYNLRSLIHAITVLPGDRPPLRVELGLSQQEGTGRPDEVLDALGLDALTAHVTRTAITFET